MDAYIIFMDEIEKVALVSLRASSGVTDPRVRTLFGRLLRAVPSPHEDPAQSKKMMRLLHGAFGTFHRAAGPDIASTVAGKVPSMGSAKRILRGIEAARGPFLEGTGPMGDPKGFEMAHMPRHQALQLLKTVPKEMLSKIHETAGVVSDPKQEEGWKKLKAGMFR